MTLILPLLPWVGIDEVNDPKLTPEEALVDNMRIDYYYRHLYFLQKAIR